MQEHSSPEREFDITDKAPQAPVSVEPLATEQRVIRAGREHLVLAALASMFVLFVLFAVTGRLDMLAYNVRERISKAEPAIAGVDLGGDEVSNIITFKDLDLHPDKVHAPYTGGAVLTSETNLRARRIGAFREFMNLYEQRQGQDDNFTIRVVDNRNNRTLELYTLDKEREHYRQTGVVKWDSIDDLRTQETRRLVDKYVARGVPKANVSVKWGRADQVKLARQAELGTIMYEVQLARYLGLSLLPTEIGTVETFNDDRLVSSVGARSRYQMMPYLLRQHGIRHYDLRTAAGNVIAVTEEWHPLLTMEPAFTTLKGYINAVGHEIPGISAYHTGPGNVFMVYRSFLGNNRSNLTPTTNVMDAYMWAITDGYNTVSNGTSFKSYSRGYVASGYGALKAMENSPIDTTLTVLAERVQLKPGRQIYLSQLLRVLDRQRDQLVLRGEHPGLYDVFRQLNPHIALPEADDSTAVPTRADVELTATSGGGPVRFFLPLGASSVLKRAGMNILDDRATFVYDHDTYGDPNRYKTEWDRQYDDLVQDIGHFGFTFANRAKLARLAARFEELAAANPTHYRLAQLEIIRTHKTIWETSAWNQIAAVVAQAAPALHPQPNRPLPASGNGAADVAEAR